MDIINGNGDGNRNPPGAATTSGNATSSSDNGATDTNTTTKTQPQPDNPANVAPFNGAAPDNSGFWGTLGDLLVGDHDYWAGPNVICDASWGCSAQLVRSIYSQVQNGVPGNAGTGDALIVSGQTYTVYQNGVPVGMVQSYVGDGGLVVNNVTDWAGLHIFFDGWANRNAYQADDGTWYSITHGSGTTIYGGFIMAGINQAFGPGIFNNIDRSISAQLYTATHH
jgi:hypothetical protein